MVKGPVSGAQVCAYKAVSTGKGEQITCVTSSSSGTYTFDTSYSGDVVIEATGGTYTDEATGASTALSAPLQVVVHTELSSTTTGVITPLTAAAFSASKSLTGGVTSANFTTAASTVASQFQLSGVNLAVTLPTVTGTLNDYGKILRAVSQYIANGKTLTQFVAFNDPTALQAGFASAYLTINGSNITFTFPGASTGGTGGTEQCGITVSGSGTVSQGGFTFPFTLPATKICIAGVPAGTCAAGNSTLQNLAAGGATPTGNYSISYQYSYAANDCSGAIATITYVP